MTDRSWQLRAMSAPELLDETIRLYRHGFVTFIGIVALLEVPMTLLSTAISSYVSGGELVPDPDALDPVFVAGAALVLLAVLNGLLVQPLIMAATARAVSDRYLGRPISVPGAYRGVLGRFFPLLGAILLVFLTNMGVALPLILATMIPCAGAVAAIGLVVALAVVNIRLSFVAQAAVLESCSPRAALARSWDLVKGSGWRVAGIVIVLFIFSALIVEGPTYALTYILGTAGASPIIDALVSGVVAAVLTVFYTPIRMAGLTLLYYDLRIRTEGLDLELQAQSLVAEIADAPPPGSLPPLPAGM